MNGLDLEPESPVVQSSEHPEEIQKCPSDEHGALRADSGSKLVLLDSKLLDAPTPSQAAAHDHTACSPDVFSNAPFPGQGKGDIFTSAPFPHVHRAHPQPDVFLQAPFCRRIDQSVPPQPWVFSNGNEPVLPHPPVHSQIRFPHSVEVPMPQQPIAAHRVVSSVGQQAAVSSVPVGPLHSWTVGVRAVMDPFLAAPFQPRGPLGKP